MTSSSQIINTSSFTFTQFLRFYHYFQIAVYRKFLLNNSRQIISAKRAKYSELVFSICCRDRPHFAPKIKNEVLFLNWIGILGQHFGVTVPILLTRKSISKFSILQTSSKPIFQYFLLLLPLNDFKELHFFLPISKILNKSNSKYRADRHHYTYT